MYARRCKVLCEGGDRPSIKTIFITSCPSALPTSTTPSLLDSNCGRDNPSMHSLESQETCLPPSTRSRFMVGPAYYCEKRRRSPTGTSTTPSLPCGPDPTRISTTPSPPSHHRLHLTSSWATRSTAAASSAALLPASSFTFCPPCEAHQVYETTQQHKQKRERGIQM